MFLFFFVTYRSLGSYILINKMAFSKVEKTILVLAFITVFLDTLNHALIVPILPYLVDELNSTSMEEGILFSAYSVMQLISMLYSQVNMF